MRFDVVFNLTNQRIPVTFNESATSFSASFDALHLVHIREGTEYYEGEYGVTPKVEAQVLPTAKKTMKDDVTVRAIPYYAVSNPAGSKTIYIAKEI